MTDRFENDPFAGEGEVRELCRATDWSATSVGPIEEWSAALRTTVRTCLDSPFPIALWCGSKLNLIYNDAYIQVLGDKHPAIGCPGAEVWSEIWEDIGLMFEQIRAGGPPAYAEDAPFVIRRAGGGAERPEASPPAADSSDGDSGRAGPNAWFTFALSPVRDATGEIVAMLNIVSETTGRVLAERETRAARARAEQAEERLVEIFTHAPAFMAVVRGRDHVFEYVNASYYQLVGHRDLIGLPVREALPEIRGQGFEELLDQVVRTGVPFVGRETPVLLARVPGEEPEEHFLDFVYYPITESDGRVTGVVAHGSDVTEHVRSRNEAQRARVEAEEANRAKSKFLANMSHEIRTPINAIMGYTDLLELGTAGPLNEKQRNQLERVRASSHHLLTLVNDVLDVAKVEAGRMEMEIVHASAADAAATAIALVRPQASDRGIRLEDRCTADTTATYSGDENRVRQILVNLLSNAIKFTDPGGLVVVECGSAEVRDVDLDVDAEGPFTYLRVTDTGIGIEPQELEKVFRPFTQIDDGHTRNYGGTGLGLTISRQLARMMGGDFTVQSVPGEGSTFTLWLPSEPAPEDEPLLPETTTAPPRHLARVGKALQDRLLAVLHRFDDRLRTHPQMPGAADLSDADLQDHASSFLADIAQSLVALEKGEAISSQLLKDGSEIQRAIAELHGRQRAQLGWSREALAAEWSVLLEEMQRAVRSGLPEDLDADDALDVMARFVDRAKRISIRSHRHMTQTM